MSKVIAPLIFTFFCVVNAGFNEDLKNHIHKLIAESGALTSEQISFCHLPPSGFRQPEEVVDTEASQFLLKIVG